MSFIPILLKYSCIDVTIALFPLTVWPSTVRYNTTVVLDFLLIALFNFA